MNCPSCGQRVPEGSERCPHCDHVLSVQPPVPPANVPLACPRCGAQLSALAPYCPNCGTPIAHTGAWPPPPAEQGPVPPVKYSGGGEQVGGFMAGCLATLFLGPVYGLGLVLSGVVYLLTRRKSPVFARWVGFGTAAGLALILGLLVICYPMMKSL